MEQTKTFRVMIAEDYELIRQGLSYTLNEQEGISVIAEAENGQQAIDKVAQLRPDIVLMDIGMPILDGIKATQHIKRQYPDVKVIMLTSHNQPEEVYAALTAGADAYCMKDIKTERLCQVIQVIQEGALWLDPTIASIILQALPAPGQEGRPGGSGSEYDGESSRKKYNVDLTAREKEVLKLIVEGKSNKEIAATLEVTMHTAKAHVTNIIQKLAVDDRTQVAIKALKEGLVDS
jgi:DNA-binding NarL/FixJ family response regulator